jgi:hypothetical protein
MRAEVLKDLLVKLDECDAAPDAVAEFRRLIEIVGARHGVSVTGRTDRIEFARQLLDTGAPRAEVRDRLMARFDIKESQAYRDIHGALQIVPKTAGFWDSAQA